MPEFVYPLIGLFIFADCVVFCDKIFGGAYKMQKIHDTFDTGVQVKKFTTDLLIKYKLNVAMEFEKEDALYDEKIKTIQLTSRENDTKILSHYQAAHEIAHALHTKRFLASYKHRTISIFLLLLSYLFCILSGLFSHIIKLAVGFSLIIFIILTGEWVVEEIWAHYFSAKEVQSYFNTEIIAIKKQLQKDSLYKTLMGLSWLAILLSGAMFIIYFTNWLRMVI